MSIANFIPEIWAQNILMDLAALQTSEAFTNRNYEGEISDSGDKVNIVTPTGLTVKDYTGDDITFENIESTTQQLLIDQQKYVAFNVKDIDAAQAKPAVFKVYSGVATQAMADEYDKDIYEYLKDKAHADNLIVEAALTSSNIAGLLAEAKKALDWAKVPAANRSFAISPDEAELINNSDKLNPATPVGDARILNGSPGRLKGFDIVESANLPEDVPATIATAAEIVVTYREVVTDVATLTTSSVHGYSVGDVVKVSGMSDATYDQAEAEITVVGSTTTFSYALTHADEAESAESGGVVRTANIPYYRYLPFGSSMATTVAKQLVQVEAVRLEKNFGDGFKSLFVYGRKTIMAKALGIVKVQLGTI